MDPLPRFARLLVDWQNFCYVLARSPLRLEEFLSCGPAELLNDYGHVSCDPADPSYLCLNPAADNEVISYLRSYLL